METETVGAFVVGVIVPLIIAIFGRESVGKLLLGRERREDTALSALIELTKESIAGWRESNIAVMNLSETMGRHSDSSEQRGKQIVESQGDMASFLHNMNSRLDDFNYRLGVLIKCVGGSDE